MKLLPAEALVLATIQHQPQLTSGEIKKLTGLSINNIHYIINKLKDRGILGALRPSINPYPLGYSDYTCYLSIKYLKPEAETEILKKFKSTPEVVWVVSIGGSYQLACSIIAKHPSVAAMVMNKIFSSSKANFAYDLVIRQELLSFGRKYLTEKKVGGKYLGFGGASKDICLTTEQYQILKFLKTGEYRSFRDVASILKIPTATCLRQIHRLEQEQIISGYYYNYDPTSFGWQVYNILLATNFSDQQNYLNLRSWAERHPQVTFLITNIGTWQYEIVVEVKNAREVQKIVSELQREFSSYLSKFQVVPVFEYLKIAMFPEESTLSNKK